jgi:hypothetical protein
LRRAITASSDTLRLSPDLVWVISSSFESVGLGRGSDALELYRGDFLDGFNLRNAPEFEQWHQRSVLACEQARARRASALADESNATHQRGCHRRGASLELAPHDEARFAISSDCTDSQAIERERPRGAADPAARAELDFTLTQRCASCRSESRDTRNRLSSWRLEVQSNGVG